MADVDTLVRRRTHAGLVFGWSWLIGIFCNLLAIFVDDDGIVLMAVRVLDLIGFFGGALSWLVLWVLVRQARHRPAERDLRG